MSAKLPRALSSLLVRTSGELILQFVAGLLLFQQQPVRADTIVINFEDLPDGTPVTTQYAGLTFSNTTVITAGISLNEFEFPPNSGTNVVFDDGGPISISFDDPVLNFGGYFTYLEPLTLAAFYATSDQVASATSLFGNNLACGDGPPCLGDPGSSPNEFISVAFAAGISGVTVTGDPAGGSFAMDDVVYTTSSTAVPEPSGVDLLLIAAMFLYTTRRHIRH
jgi:hypothetical protein